MDGKWGAEVLLSEVGAVRRFRQELRDLLEVKRIVLALPIYVSHHFTDNSRGKAGEARVQVAVVFRNPLFYNFSTHLYY